MPKFELTARVAVVCTIALIVLIGILGKQDARGKIAWDWPFIGVYALLFLCIASMYISRGQIPYAIATAAFILATAVFDTMENLSADPQTHLIIVSKPKWFCFFVCVLLTIPLFATVRTWLTGVIMVLLLVAGVAGLIGTLLMPPGAHQSTQLVFGSSGAAILAFLLACIIFVRSPKILLP